MVSLLKIQDWSIRFMYLDANVKRNSGEGSTMVVWWLVAFYWQWT